MEILIREEARTELWEWWEEERKQESNGIYSSLPKLRPDFFATHNDANSKFVGQTTT